MSYAKKLQDAGFRLVDPDAGRRDLYEVKTVPFELRFLHKEWRGRAITVKDTTGNCSRLSPIEVQLEALSAPFTRYFYITEPNGYLTLCANSRGWEIEKPDGYTVYED